MTKCTIAPNRVLFAATRKLAGLLCLGLFSVVSLLVVYGLFGTAKVQAAPSTLNFQARLQTNTGAIVPDGNYNVEFKLYNAASSSGSSQGACTGDANCLWTETRTSANTVQVKNGYLTVNLGSVTSFGSLDFSQQLWLTMRVGGTGAPTWDPEMGPNRLLVTASAYAFQAGNAQTLGGIAAGGFVQNTTTVQANTSLAIQSAADANVTAFLQGRATQSAATLLIKQGSSQTGNLVTVQDSTGTNTIFSLNQFGQLYAGYASTFNANVGVGIASDTTYALKVAASGGTGQTGLYVTANNSGQTADVADFYGPGGRSLVYNAAGTLTLATDAGQTANAETQSLANTSGVQTNGLQINRNAAGGTTTNGINITQTAGTLTNGLAFSGAIGTDINRASGTLSLNGAGGINLQTSGTTTASLSSSGAASFQNSSDSTTGLQVKKSSGAGGATVLDVDTTNGRVGIGTAAPSRSFDVAVNNTQVAAPMALLEQAGTGDAALELKNAGATSSFYISNDASNGNALTLNSYAAATTTAPATITNVQSISTNNNLSSANISLGFGSNNTAGNFIVVAVTFDSTNTSTATCSDTAGNSYSQAFSRVDSVNNDVLIVCYAANIAAASGNVVTVTFGGVSNNTHYLALHEYSGVATSNPLDVTNTNVAAGTTAVDNITSGLATTTQNGDLIFGSAVATSGTTSLTAGTGFTQRSAQASVLTTQDRTLASAGSIASTNTFGTARTYIAGLAAFKANTGGSLTDTNTNALLTLSATGALKLQGVANSAQALQVNNFGGVALLTADTQNSSVIVKSPTNNTTAFQVQNASGAAVLTVDTTNIRLSIGSQGTATGQLYVAGVLPTAAAGSVATGTAPGDIYVQGRYAYVINGTSATLQIFDISNPAAPLAVGSVATGTAPKNVVVQGRYAYVVNTTTPVLQIFDVSNPASPSSVGSVATGVNPRGLNVQGRYAYVANQGSDTIQSFDVSNPAAPVSVSTFSPGAGTGPITMSVQGRYAYVGDFSDGVIRVIDIANPAAMTSAGTLTGPGTSSTRVVAQGRYAYVTYTTSIAAYNISSTTPVLLNTLSLGGNPQTITIQGRYAYVANFGSNTIQVVDISNPSALTLVGTIATGAGPISAAIRGRYLEVADLTASTLQTFDLGGGYFQQLETGGLESASLSVLGNTALNDTDVRGGLQVSRSAEIAGGLGVTGTANFKSEANSTTAFQVQNASGTNVLTVDTTNSALQLLGSTLVKTPSNSQTAFQVQNSAGTLLNGINSIAAGTGNSAAAGSNAGGSLSGSAATTYYYKVTGITPNGESVPSAEFSINGASFTTLSAPTALTAAASATAGNVSCNNTAGQGCKYEVTYVTANGETTAGTATASLLNVTTKQINLTAIPTGPAGTTARNIYRSTNNGAYLFIKQIADNTTTVLTDNLAAANAGGSPPASNSARTNTNNVTVTFGTVTGATSYRIYRGTASGAETAYQTTAASPFTDTGTAGTAGAGRLATNTVAGTMLIQPANDSVAAWQVLNAAGTATVGNIDTVNQRFGINTPSATGNLQVNQNSLTPGTVTNSASSANVTGSGTTFTTTFQAGDSFTITSSGNSCTVASITSDTALTCTATLAGSSAGSTYSFTQQARLTIANNGATTIGGELVLASATQTRAFGLLTNPSNNKFQVVSNAIGNTGNNASINTDTGNMNFISSSKYDSGPGGQINTIYVYFPIVDTAPNNHAKVAVYSNNAGVPGTLLSSPNAPTTVVTSSTWSPVSLGTTITLAPHTTYWLGFSVDSNTTNYAYAFGSAGDSAYMVFSPTDPFPATWVTGSAPSSNDYSIYAPYISVTSPDGGKGTISVGDNGNTVFKPLYDDGDIFDIQKANGNTIFTVNSALSTSSFDGSLNLNTGGDTSAALVGFNNGNQVVGSFIQQLTSDTLQATSTNTSGTQTNGVLYNRNGGGGTTTNGVNITNTAGTLTNGLAFTGTIGTDINRASGTLSINGANGTTLSSSTNGATSLTVNSTSGTAGTVAVFNQALGADGVQLTNTGTGTQTNNLLVTRTGATGTTTNAINIFSNGGTVTNGLAFNGTIGTDIARGSGTLTVQGAGGIALTSSGGNVQIGSSTTDAVATLLILDSYNQASDPTEVDGAIYYNSNSKSFRCGSNGAFKDCMGGLRYAQTSVAGGDTVANTATETNFADNYTIPANDCVVGRVYRVTASGQVSVLDATQRLTYRVKFGATSVAAGPGVQTSAAASNPFEWQLTATITCTGASAVEADGVVAHASTNTTNNWFHTGLLNSGNAVTLTGTNVLQISAQWGGASASNTITMRSFIVEALGPK